MTDDFENLQKKLQEALIEIEQLRQENAQLKTVFKESPSCPSQKLIRRKYAIIHLSLCSD
jgi:hypothetical protein